MRQFELLPVGASRVVAIMGVLLAGSAYVPVDGGSPAYGKNGSLVSSMGDDAHHEA